MMDVDDQVKKWREDIAQEEEALEKAGICSQCYGRGGHPDPKDPTDDIMCTRCNGTGKTTNDDQEASE